MTQSILKPIPEEIIPAEAVLFGRPAEIADHTRFCKCLACRHFYEEDDENCAEEGCILPSSYDCENHYCFKHCKQRCAKLGTL